MTYTDEYRAECPDCGYRDQVSVPARQWQNGVREATTRHEAFNLRSCSGDALRVMLVERDVPRCDFCGHDTSTDFEPHCCAAMLVSTKGVA